MSQDVAPLNRLLDFLRVLDQNAIYYQLESVRDAIMVVVTVPGQRWEVEFFPDGHIEIERFISSGEIEGEELLAVLIRDYGEEA